MKPDASDEQVRKAYHDMQKICHPDIAGEEGAEVCYLLNEAYDILHNPEERAAYDRQTGQGQVKVQSEAPEVADLGPTWPWTPRMPKKQPTWSSKPQSRSIWQKVKEEDRGAKHAAQQFLYVDAWQCISCRNCCDIAPSSFCIDAENGRARVYTQWGNSEEYLDYATQSCPTNCIHWVSREDLQTLEFVTSQALWSSGNELPCPMQARNGLISGMQDPFAMAERMKQEEQAKKDRRKTAAKWSTRLTQFTDRFRERIQEVFSKLSPMLKDAIFRVSVGRR